jgi:DNA adenine methylase
MAIATAINTAFRSPLRYPGGKQRAAKRIADLFPSDKPLHIASPFFGGGSVELELASRGHKVTGSDFFAPVAAFWQQLKSNKEDLHAMAMDFVPDMDKETFYGLQRDLRDELAKDKPSFQRLAWLFFVINRSSFSGATLSGGMATGDRFNRNAVNRLLPVDLSSIEVRHGDYWNQLFDRKRRRFRFDAVYADPPYCLEVSKLYGDQGSTHEDFDHARFAKHMNWCSKQGARIVISYNDCPAVRQLFAGWTFKEVSWAYGMNASKQSNEILITNF